MLGNEAWANFSIKEFGPVDKSFSVCNNDQPEVELVSSFISRNSMIAWLAALEFGSLSARKRISATNNFASVNVYSASSGNRSSHSLFERTRSTLTTIGKVEYSRSFLSCCVHWTFGCWYSKKTFRRCAKVRRISCEVNGLEWAALAAASATAFEGFVPELSRLGKKDFNNLLILIGKSLAVIWEKVSSRSSITEVENLERSKTRNEECSAW